MLGSAFAAMSGGVDSTVAAMLAIRDGIDCEGAVMKLHHAAADLEAGALSAAAQLGIQLYIYDFSGQFALEVIERFISAYREGRTPNPCIDCNKYLKFGRLMEKARERGKSCVITGHYARTELSQGGRYLLKKGVDTNKDQSYVLYTLAQEQLAYVRFPLGGLTKQEVREFALAAGLNNARKVESQDICFIPAGGYVKFIQEYTGEQPQKGRFIDIDGNDLGENKGVINYTIGQRRGLGLAMPYPPYVLELRPETGDVVVGENEKLYSKSLLARDINLIPIDRIDFPMRARAKIRYNQREQPATVRQIDDNTLSVDFDEPQRAVTKGQSVVIYDGDVVIGGGTIV